MWILFTAVVTASLLGSMHCVGMCGPLAIWATGAGEPSSKTQLSMTSTLYHVGRLVTYLIAGVIAGGIGSLVETGGQWIGYQVVAARLVGGIMIGVGVWKLWSMVCVKAASGAVQPSRIGGLLIKLRPYLFRLPLAGRALGTGMLTTLLPCGWLYLFALIAAGTGSLVMGPVVMFAFWIGTVPALTGLVIGTRALSDRFIVIVPALAATLLVIAGVFTSLGRGFAELNSLADLRPAVMQAGDSASVVTAVKQAHEQPLPCCEHCLTADKSNGADHED